MNSALHVAWAPPTNRNRLWWAKPILLLLAAALADSGSWAQELKAETKSSPEAVTLYADAASYQNNGAFELAVEEWTRFLAKFPNDPLTPKAQHYQGICNLQLKRLDKAAAAFQAVVSKYPKFDSVEEAYLNLGWCQYTQAQAGKTELFATASQTFVAMLKAHPTGKFSDRALFFQAESLYHQNRKQDAIPLYESLRKDHPKSAVRADGLYALGVTHEELGQYPEAGPVYDQFLKEFAKHDLVTEIQMRKAETVLQAGLAAEADKKDAAAKKLFAQAEAAFAAVAGAKDFASADHALNRQAFSMARQNRVAEAAVIYARIPADFPNSPYAKEALLNAGRSYYAADKFDEAAPLFKQVLETNDATAVEAAHWLCRIELKNKRPVAAVELAKTVIPKAAADNVQLVNLKLDLADALYEIPERQQEALDLYLKIAADHPKSEKAPDARYYAAFTALELKKFDEGLKQSAAFLTAYPEHRLKPDVQYVAAECNLLLKKYDAAQKAYADLLAAYPNHEQASLWRQRHALSLYLEGTVDFEAGRFDQAAKTLAASLAASPKWSRADETLLLVARCLARLDQRDEGLQTLKQVIQEFPQSKHLDQAHYRWGEMSLDAKDFKTALAEFDQVATKWPDSEFAPFALYHHGLCNFESKEYTAGVKSFSALIEKHASHKLVSKGHFYRAMCRRLAGDNKGAVEDSDVFLKSNPELSLKSDALLEKGLAQASLKDFAASATTFDEILRHDRKFAQADKVLYELGWALKSQGKNAEAVAIFAKLAQEFPAGTHAAEANFHVADNLYDNKKFADAQKAYSQAKQRAPKGDLAEKATYKLGWSSYELKQYEAALAEFTEQVQAYPQGTLVGDGQFMVAESLFKLGKYQEALPAYAAALAASPASGTIETLILLHAGQSAAQLKQWSQSLKYFESLPKKFPESPFVAEARYEQGWALQNLDKTQEALAAYEEAATKSRTEVGARARFMMGEIHFTAKDFDEAIKQFQRAMFGFGGEQATPEVKNWQSKSGYEAARCNEVRILSAKDAAEKAKLVAEAKKNYQYVVDKHPQSDEAAQAKKRLAELSKIK